MPVSISKLPEVTNVKDNSFMLITQDGTTKRTMCDQFVTEEEARLDEFSPTVITSKSMSKTGEGDNVDYSSSAYDAPMKDVVLKGKTMVNCIQEPSSQDVVLPYEFEDGQYVTINDTKESGTLGVELKGQTLVNIPTAKTYYVSNKLTSEWVATFQESVDSVKTNTKYYIGIFNNSEETKSYGLRFNPFTVTSKITIDPKSYGFLIGTTVSDINSTALIINASDHNLDNNVDILFIEYQEGMENWEIPYFEGMTSCKMPILCTVGKNLFDIPLVQGSQTYGTIGGKPVLEFYPNRVTNQPNHYIKVAPNTEITFSIKNEIGFAIAELDSLGNRLGDTGWLSDSYKTITTKPTTHYIGFNFRKLDGSALVPEEVVQSSPMLEYSTSPTNYEPHKSSSLSLPEEVVLRSLPNGVCDTFNTRTGVYTQRVGAMVLNGSDPITSRMEQTDNVLTTTSRCYLDYASIPSDISMKPFSSANGVSNKLICDILPVKAVVPNMQQDDIESVGQTTAGFSIRVKGKTIAECRQRLAEQPVTIQYELATPIITKINLSSTLKSWNTTTHIYSEIPENTLYPILSHSNATYPAILKPSTKYSIVANSYSNNHTNSTINFNLGGATATTAVGNRVTTITTPSTLSNELLTMSGRGNKLNNVMVIEGDVAGDEPYFEGICDVKSPILSNTGKNLFDLKSKLLKGEYTYNNPYIYVPISKGVITNNNTTTVSVSCKNLDGSYSQITPKNYYTSHLSTILSNNSGDVDKSIVIRSQSVCHQIAEDGQYYFSYTDSSNSESKMKEYLLSDNFFIQIEHGETQATTCEPYKSNTTTFEQKDDKTIVLRSLPNDVCDTLNVETGEYVQRIGEVVKNNSTGFSLSTGGWENKTKVCTFEHFKPEGMKVQNANDKPTLNCDRVSSNTFLTQWGNSEGIESITQHSGGNIVLSIAREKLSTQDSAGLNLYLQSNPLTIQYELETPIVTTIDIQGFPYAYKDGHVQLSSGSIEQSLTPKVEYNIATNRGGQITQNTKSLIRQGKLLNDIENKINQIIEATVNDGIMLMKLRNK